MKRTLKVRVGSVESALDRFEEVWSKAARGEKVPAEHVLTFVNLQLLLRTLTPARWTLLERLRADGPLSVNRTCPAFRARLQERARGRETARRAGSHRAAQGRARLGRLGRRAR